MKEEDAEPSTEDVLATQRAYYERRAPDYLSVTRASDRNAPGLFDADDARALVDELQPIGDVLELACGPGMFTRELTRHARSLTAVDASVSMLARNRNELADSRIRYVHADLFAWRPDRAYDSVFFGFWLSHVPPTAFGQFWTLVRECLAPGGRVAFVDEDDRGAAFEEVRLVGGVPVARRTLSDGTHFDIVKAYWDPASLEARLSELSFDVQIRRVGETFMYGVGRDGGT